MDRSRKFGYAANKGREEGGDAESSEFKSKAPYRADHHNDADTYHPTSLCWRCDAKEERRVSPERRDRMTDASDASVS